ncbi:TKL protein kinase [Fonticula alba]|uniref:TKL protein kinase n=1 Tax=Fonticula alba TaxID=691883 RepID=A0A058Z695_FONAL|nr:TKL protein kinase [Fonticula alba]KCV69022.1 TKL protein kinase [Fonticula alba]|eukprot:XP_009496593.1 TKL protein kinase [Fonticula alba]
MALEFGVDPNAVNSTGDTALHYAAMSGNLDLVEKLIAASASLNVANDHGNIPLHYSCFWRHEHISRFLIEKGELVTAVNSFQKSPLDRAGPELSAALLEFAQQCGQETSAQVQLPTRNFEEAESIARIRFLIKNAPSWQVSSNLLDFQELLASPSPFASVYKGEWSGFQVAIKQPHPHIQENKQMTSNMELDILDKQVTMMRDLFHVNLLPILAGCTERGNWCLVTEFQPVGNLGLLLQDPAYSMDQYQAIRFAVETCRGVAFLHENGIPHGALKPSNILVTDDGGIRITDYGLSKVKAFRGSYGGAQIFEPHWIAPEIFLEEPHPDKDIRPADVYAFGMVLFMIVTRLLPFESMHPMAIGHKVVTQSLRPTMPYFVPEHLSKLISLCWQQDHTRRPLIGQVLPILEKLHS